LSIFLFEVFSKRSFVRKTLGNPVEVTNKYFNKKKCQARLSIFLFEVFSKRSFIRKTVGNPIEVTNKSKSKQNHKACFFDFVDF